MLPLLRFMLCAVMISAITGCSLMYRPDIVQGNYLGEKEIARLNIGMTRAQVQYIMGSPMLEDPFENNVMTYISRVDSRDEGISQSFIQLYFKGDKLTKIDRQPSKTT